MSYKPIKKAPYNPYCPRCKRKMLHISTNTGGVLRDNAIRIRYGFECPKDNTYVEYRDYKEPKT